MDQGVNLFFSLLLSDTAQGFGGEPQVGGDLVLRKALLQGRVFGDERMVLFFGRLADRADDPLLLCHKRILQQDPEHPVEFRDLLIKFLQVIFLDGEYLGVLQGVDVLCSGCAGQEAVEVGDPPSLHGKHHDVLRAIVVYGIGPETSLNHKIFVEAYVARLQQVLALSQFPVTKHTLEKLDVLLRQHDVSRNVLKDKFVRIAQSVERCFVFKLKKADGIRKKGVVMDQSPEPLRQPVR